MKNKNKLLIIGASGHGKVVADIAIKMKMWEQIAFLDDNETIKSAMGLEVIGRSGDAFSLIDRFDIFVAIGSNKKREMILRGLEKAGACIPILIHPGVTIGERVVIQPGSVIMAGAVINCCSRIGRGCIVNTGATLDHDNELGNYVHISPGVHLAGSVKIGERTWLGIGSVVCNNIEITSDCVIGAGAVVIDNIREAGTYVGIPARSIGYESSK